MPPAAAVRRGDQTGFVLPELPSSSLRYADLYRGGAFSQRRLLSADQLRKEAARRGIPLAAFGVRGVLEPLDRSGRLQPIGFALTAHSPESTFLRPDPDAIAFREDRPFAPWSSYARPDEGRRQPRERYSAWQLLYIAEALDEHWPVPMAALDGCGERLLAWRDEARPRIDAERARQNRLEKRWQPVIKLLIALQTRYWRRVCGRSVPVQEGAGDLLDPAERELPQLRGRALLRGLGLKPSNLKELHARLARRARAIDPMPEWYLLARQAPRKRYELLRGEAARAGDLYDACDLIRSFYADLTGTELPACDELVDPPAYRRLREQRFGHPPPYGGRRDLKRILQIEGLYPHALHIFVEGQTEEVVLHRVLGALGFRVGAGRVHLTNIHGVDQARRHAALFASVSAYATRTVLVADREGSIAQVAARLVDDGLLDAEEDVVLWGSESRPSSFEEANFSDVELLRMMRTLAARQEPPARLVLTVRQLRAARDAMRSEVNAGRRAELKGLADVALRLAERPEHGAVRLSRAKSKALPEEMSRRLIADIKRIGMVEAGARRPILRYLRFWILAEGQRAREGRPHVPPGEMAAGTAEGDGMDEGSPSGSGARARERIGATT